MSSRTSKTGMKDPHQKEDFWLRKENHYWETDMYTEEGKKYLRNMVKELKEEKFIKHEQNGKPLNSKHL